MIINLLYFFPYVLAVLTVMFGVLVLRDYSAAAKRQKELEKKVPEFLAIIRASLDEETKEELLERLMRLSKNMSPSVLESVAQRMLDAEKNVDNP